MLNWTKICRTCKEIKVAPEYYSDKDNSDGLESVCIKCSELAFNSFLTLGDDDLYLRSIKDRSDHVTEGNVFEDLGFTKEEAKSFKESSDKRLKALSERAWNLLDD